MIESANPNDDTGRSESGGAADPLDGLLRELGTEVPFSVDWAAYERTLMARLARNQRAARWKSWRAAAIGSMAGAAAMLLLSLSLIRPEKPETRENSTVPQSSRKDPVERPSQKEKEPAPEPDSSGGSYARLGRGSDGKASGFICDNYQPSDEPIKPFTRRSPHKDGRTGEIRFEGFSDGTGTPSVIAVTSK